MSNHESLRLEEIRRNDLLLQSVTGFAIYMLDVEGRICTWNSGACALKGYEARDILGEHLSVFYTIEDQANKEAEKGLRIAAESGYYESEGWRVRKGGGKFWASIVIEPVYEEGELIGFANVTRDISRHHETEERLARTSSNLEVALTHMCQGLVLFDSSGRVILANQRLSEIFAVSAEKIQVDMDYTQLMTAVGFSRHRTRQIESRMQSLRPAGDPFHSEEESCNGRIIAVSIRCMPGGGWVSTFEDVTARRIAEVQLEYFANYDALTGLPNRIFFLQRIREAIARAKRGIPLALLVIDLRDFSSLNDRLGPTACDQILRSFAGRIRDHVRDIDTVARLDGDEFAILQTGPDLPRDAEALAARLIRTFASPIEIDGQPVNANASIGIALSTGEDTTVGEMLREADLALIRAKQLAVPTYSFFNARIDSELQDRRILENDLSQALERKELRLHYQAIVDVATAQVKGYEALLRWLHPKRGWIAPSEFIPIAEESGLIVSIGEWVLQTACTEAAGWPSPVHVAVNLSPVQFQNGLVPGTVERALAASGLAPYRLELEITESLLLEHCESNLASLSQLRTLGTLISLDDFGIGYSSLGYLRSFKFDKLKIDRSFVLDLPSDSSVAIIAAIIGLGKNFDIRVVAEGVETQQQLEYLQQYGCDEVQGYLMGRPTPPKLCFANQKDGSTDVSAPGHARQICA
jgi:diguanylate cyclase (GGDEF)-like protein/PAS domain S-box-containing protein